MEPQQQQTVIYGPGDQPFLTDDSVLAFALYMAFAQFSDNECPCVNSYTKEQLRQLGYSGVLPTEAALQAVQAGKKGEVIYVFQSLKQPEMLVWFKDQYAYLKDGEGFARDAVRNLLNDLKLGVRTYEETLVRLVCTIVFMWAEFISMWQKLEPLIKIVSDKPATRQELPDGSVIMTHEGFKYIGARASKETQQKLGLC